MMGKKDFKPRIFLSITEQEFKRLNLKKDNRK